MKGKEKAWARVPDFSVQLRAAMDARGLSSDDVARRMNRLGYEDVTRTQVHRLYRPPKDPITGKRRRVNPTLLTVAGLAQACDVDVQWFFQRDSELTALLDSGYEQMTAPPKPQ